MSAGESQSTAEEPGGNICFLHGLSALGRRLSHPAAGETRKWHRCPNSQVVQVVAGWTDDRNCMIVIIFGLPTEKLDSNDLHSVKIDADIKNPTYPCTNVQSGLSYWREEQHVLQSGDGFHDSDTMDVLVNSTKPSKRLYLHAAVCPANEALDCAMWSLWKKSEDEKASERSFLPSESERHSSSPQLMDSYFQGGCQLDLEHAVQGRSDVEKIYLRRALYCVSVCFRSLHLAELLEAVTTPVDNESPLSLSTLISHPLKNSNDLMHLCGKVLATKPDGTVGFRRDGMRSFLLNSQLPEMRNSHQTMASICLEQIKRVGKLMILRPWAGFRRTLANIASYPLLRYVTTYWDTHYRLGEQKSRDLPGELFHLVEAACLAQMPPGEGLIYTYLRHQVIETTLQVCHRYRFDRLASICREMGACTISCGCSYCVDPICYEEQARRTKSLVALLLKHNALRPTSSQGSKRSNTDISRAIEIFGMRDADHAATFLQQLYFGDPQNVSASTAIQCINSSLPNDTADRMTSVETEESWTIVLTPQDFPQFTDICGVPSTCHDLSTAKETDGGFASQTIEELSGLAIRTRPIRNYDTNFVPPDTTLSDDQEWLII